MFGDDVSELSDQANILEYRIAPLLKGNPAPVIGAALANLLATWLAGHVIVGEPQETSRLRERLLRFHMEMVRQLIPVHEQRLSGETDDDLDAGDAGDIGSHVA